VRFARPTGAVAGKSLELRAPASDPEPFASRGVARTYTEVLHMKVSLTRLVLACAMCGFVAAAVVHADDMSSSSSMQMKQQMPTPGAESKALEKFFGSNATWTGNIPAGAFGPDSKASKSHGHMMSTPLYGGFWYMCDVTDAMGSGKEAMTWKGHMMVGYDMATKSYRGTCIDNMGQMTTFNGTLDGDKFTLETPEPVSMMGQMMKDRLTWTLNADGSSCAFTDEHQMAGASDWTTAETATMHSSKSMASHHTAAKSEKMASSEKK
jgi:Protein of unknown function (DUF1579)